MDLKQLPEDVKEFLSFLNSEKVDYLLVGGWAVGVYATPRFTGDIDVWVEISPGNKERKPLK